MRNRAAWIVVALSLAGASGGAFACGYCVEDRVAAVYDHDAVEGALAQRRNVAFFGIEGEVAGTEASRRALVSAVEKAGGIKGTSRVALENAAISVAYDPARTTLDSLTARANRPLAAKGLTLSPLRVIDEGGKLREP
jgi:hypothetical protein